MEELAGRHAAVTGGAGGIGAAIAAALAGSGARITLLGRDERRLQTAADAIGGAQAVCVDVIDAQSVSAAFARAAAAYGAVDILVNAAGAAHSDPFERTTQRDWQRLMDVNLTGTFLCCREVVPSMKVGGYGRIINVASTAGLRGYRYVSAYCAAKHGVVGLTRALALELAEHKITVNAVCPGYTETHLLEETVANIVVKTGRSAEAARALLLEDTPRRNFVRAEEVANAVLWLCVPGSEAVTGVAIPIDGGELAG